MRIAIIAPGALPLRGTKTNGHGAVEVLCLSYSEHLRKHGHEVLVTNTPCKATIIREIREFSPDFIHCGYDLHFDVLRYLYNQDGSRPIIGITSHFGLLHLPQYNHEVQRLVQYAKDEYVFALTNKCKDIFVNQFGFPAHKVFITPNYVETSQFKIWPDNEVKNQSICLGKIDGRKRQAVLQSYDANVAFAGASVDERFNAQDKNYLGPWSKAEVYEKLGQYANLVLLSVAEIDVLVAREMMATGGGVVLSEASAAPYLGLNLPFISIIPDDRIGDKEYVKRIIEQNRKYSLDHRQEIRDYAAKHFSWDNITKYISLVESLIK